MSLTSHLDNPASPVSKYFTSHFPNIASVRLVEDPSPTVTLSPIAVGGRSVPFQMMLRFVPGDAQVLPRVDDPHRYGWGTAGTAFDYRARMLLANQDLERSVAAQGAFRLALGIAGSPRRQTGDPATPEAWPDLAAAVQSFQARRDDPGPSSPADDTEAARLCVLLAMYEQLYRAPEQYLVEHPLVVAGPGVTLTTQLGLVNDQVVDDVAAMTALLTATRPELLAFTKAAVCGPVFDGSGDLGGADADLILDGRLLELKTTKRPALDKKTVWQVLGYLLADTSDRFGISDVAWYFARHAYLWQMPVSSFLERLAGASVDLAAARAEFAAVLVDAKPSPAPRDQTAADHPTPSNWATVERLVSFYPNASGRGRRHMRSGRVVGQPGDPDRPVCGARSTLNLDVDPIRPPVGQRWDADPTLCATCLSWTRTAEGRLDHELD